MLAATPSENQTGAPVGKTDGGVSENKTPHNKGTGAMETNTEQVPPSPPPQAAGDMSSGFGWTDDEDCCLRGDIDAYVSGGISRDKEKVLAEAEAAVRDAAPGVAAVFGQVARTAAEGYELKGAGVNVKPWCGFVAAQVDPGCVPACSVHVVAHRDIHEGFCLAELLAAHPAQIPVLLIRDDGETLVVIKASQFRDAIRCARKQIQIKPADVPGLIEWKRNQAFEFSYWLCSCEGMTGTWEDDGDGEGEKSAQPAPVADGAGGSPGYVAVVVVLVVLLVVMLGGLLARCCPR